MVLLSEGNYKDLLVQPLAYPKQFLIQSPHLALELKLVLFYFYKHMQPWQEGFIQ